MHGIRRGLANLFRACTGQNQEQQTEAPPSPEGTEGLRPSLQEVEQPTTSARALESYAISSQPPPSSPMPPFRRHSVYDVEKILSNSQLPSPEATQLAEHTLKQTRVIRFFVKHTQGTGDQNAMLEAIASLKRLGFQGRIECVCQDLSHDGQFQGQRYLLEKLKQLFPQINSRTEEAQTIDWQGLPIHFIPQSQWQEYLAQLPENEREADLGISPIFGWMISQLTQDLRTRCHCIMQPYQWSGEHCVIKGSEVIHIEHKHPLRYRPMNLEYLRQLRSLVKEGMSDELSEQKSRELTGILEDSGLHNIPDNQHLRQVMKDLFSGSCQALTVYGVHHQNAMYYSSNIIGSVTGALSSINHYGKPPVMFVIGGVPVRKEWLDENSVLLNLYERTFSKDYEKAKAQGKTVVINLRFLPKKAFESLIATSHYPVLLEGANLTNLVQQLGIPYLSILPEGITPLPRLDDVESPDEYRALEHMTRASVVLKKSPPENIGVIAHFLEASSTSTAGYEELTERLQRTANDPCSDQVLYSMVAYGALSGRIEVAPRQV